MADFRLSPRAETDIAGIAEYTIETSVSNKRADIGTIWKSASEIWCRIRDWGGAWSD